MANDGQAIIIFIDNSETSINGDFYPNRLDAQKIAVERLIQFFTRVTPKTQIGIGTLAEDSFGIIASLTMNDSKLDQSITNIKRGGNTHLVHGIRCGFLALHHCDPEVRTKRMIVFVGSEHDMKDTKISTELAQHANKEDVSVDIVAFGDEVNCKDILENFTSQTHIKSYFVAAKSNTAILSDLVLSSPIGPGDVSQSNVNFEDDPDLALTIQLSMQQQDDPELQAAILESQKGSGQIPDDIDDPELALAIKLSIQDEENRTNDKKLDDKEKKNDSNDDNNQLPDDIDDPELVLALKLSQHDVENQENEKKDNDNNNNGK